MRGLLASIAHFAVAGAKPRITYFGIAGRGEVARLYAAVGGLDIEYNTDTTGYKQKTPIGYLPALSHPEAGVFPNCKFEFGCLQESLAVERYIRALAPGFASLTPQQMAVDDMVAMIKEDLIHVEPAALNSTGAASVVYPLYDRYLNMLEHDGYVPASGFVNGLSFPTGADFAVLPLSFFNLLELNLVNGRVPLCRLLGGSVGCIVCFGNIHSLRQYRGQGIDRHYDEPTTLHRCIIFLLN